MAWYNKIVSKYHCYVLINKQTKIIMLFQATYLIMGVDLRITLVMYYDCKPKNEEREKANTFEFVSQIRCHKLFTSVNSR